MQIIRNEKFTNIQNAQAGLTKLFREASRSGSFYRVLKNDEPLGVLIPNDVWEDFLEDLEAASSPKYIKRIAVARKDKKRISLDEIEKRLGIK